MTEYDVDTARLQVPLADIPFHVHESPQGAVWVAFHREGDDYRIRFPGLADFSVSADGVRVVGYPTPDTNTFTLEHLYINQVLPLARSRQGKPTFHASVVVFGDDAVAFLGHSGLGKSTLAAWLARHGARFLTDDGLLIEETPDGPRALPNHPSVRLWEDSVSAVMEGDAPCAPPLPYTSKSRLLASNDLPYCDHPVQLRAAFVLVDEGVPEPTVADLAGVDRVMGWLGNSFLLDVEDRVLISRHFEWTLRVSEQVPTRQLDYPRRYDALPAVRSIILETLGK